MDSVQERGSGVSQWPQLSRRPRPSGLWGRPTFSNWNTTSREQNQLANFFPLTFKAIIRTHLSLSEITKEKPNRRTYFQPVVISIFGKRSEATNRPRTPEFMVTQEENGNAGGGAISIVLGQRMQTHQQLLKLFPLPFPPSPSEVPPQPWIGPTGKPVSDK